ncbi:MAG: hypothetical protein SGI74_05425 [Oligoflexia bacterium]|nr:hypothetical protein [Oligoflexia bacterium]
MKTLLIALSLSFALSVQAGVVKKDKSGLSTSCKTTLAEVSSTEGQKYDAKHADALSFAEEIKDIKERYAWINVKDYSSTAKEVLRNHIIFEYAKLCKRIGVEAKFEDLASSMEVPENILSSLVKSGRLFENFEELKKDSRESKPSSFIRVMSDMFRSKERRDKLQKALKTRTRFIVVSVAAGAPVNKSFFDALLRYSKENDAEILILPVTMITEGLDPLLLDTPGVHIVTNSIDLSPELRINNIPLMAKLRNPLMGLDILAERGQSQIVGAPILMRKFIHTADNDINPHSINTTGSLTMPYYRGDHPIGQRTAWLTENDHFFGALIVEKTNGAGAILKGQKFAKFHIRNVSYSEAGKGFSDGRMFYTAEGSRRLIIKAIELGDTHVGMHDAIYAQYLGELISKFDPEMVLTNDFLDMHSISHHEQKSITTRAERFKKGELDLAKEFRAGATEINAIHSLSSRVVVGMKKSNHNNEWIHRWLSEARYVTDPINYALGVELAAAALRGEDPVEYGLKKFGLEYPKRVVFLPENFKIGPRGSAVQAGAHGHEGAGGSKSVSPKALRAIFGKSTSGHTHTVNVINDTAVVGTSTKKRIGYNTAPSNWVQGLGVIDEFGKVQVLVFADNESISEGNVRSRSIVFKENYPNIVENQPITSGANSYDQHSSYTERLNKGRRK